jgi:uncharacterized damage-inducible protein DinB
MDLKEIQTIFSYNYWADHLLLSTSRKVSDEQFAAPASIPYGGLRGTLVHTMDGELTWRMLLEKDIQTEELAQADFPTLGVLEKRWKNEEDAMLEFLSHLKDEALADVVRYTTASGVKRERILWHCLYHVVNHGTQHRSEAAAILTDLGQSPGDIDFTVFLNQRG